MFIASFRLPITPENRKTNETRTTLVIKIFRKGVDMVEIKLPLALLLYSSTHQPICSFRPSSHHRTNMQQALNAQLPPAGFGSSVTYRKQPFGYSIAFLLRKYNGHKLPLKCNHVRYNNIMFHLLAIMHSPRRLNT